jgi:hypothetical protein
MPALGPATFMRATARTPRRVPPVPWRVDHLRLCGPPHGHPTLPLTKFRSKGQHRPATADKSHMSINFAHLPPLPPITVTLKAVTPAARLPSAPWESLLVAAAVLFMGITVLLWATRLDTTGSQMFVTAAAVLTVILPKAIFTLLRGPSRRR